MKTAEEILSKHTKELFAMNVNISAAKSDILRAMEEYRLQASELPSEMPKEFSTKINELQHGFPVPLSEIWEWLVSNYGAQPKQELPSVEELAVIIKAVWRGVDKGGDIAKGIAQHIIDTYSLNSTKREWWMDLKEGDKFMCGEIVHIFKKFHHLTKLYFSENYCVDISYCTPYIEPSTIDICKEKLGAELFEKLMKEVKG